MECVVCQPQRHVNRIEGRPGTQCFINVSCVRNNGSKLVNQYTMEEWGYAPRPTATEFSGSEGADPRIDPAPIGAG